MGRCLIRRARLVTMDGAPGARRGADLGRCTAIAGGWLAIEGSRIAALGEGEPPASWRDAPSLDASGRVITPGFVDCHTHACWAGDRYSEWMQKLAGRPYAEILASGGGILSTVRAVRSSSQQELAASLQRRLAEMAALGSTAVEVKSGYGLSTAHELMMLESIEAASATAAPRVIPTFLGAHAIDPEVPGFVEQAIRETLPAVASRWPGICADLFCEKGAWDPEASMAYARAARTLGMPVRMHVDQFTDMGLVPQAIALGARSCDHLEATSPDHLLQLARSETFGVALPCTPFCLDGPYMRARAFVDAGGALALATNRNPGSAPVASMCFALALAVRKMGLTAHEALCAATWNPACLLGIEGRCGALRPGMDADLALWPALDERALAIDVAGPPPDLVLRSGRVVGGHGGADAQSLALR